MRFLYCACAISALLDDWSGVDVDLALAYIDSCKAFDGGIALLPQQESHGGSTYCAVASLVLMGKLETWLSAHDRAELVHWCMHRQVGGFQGRVNKVPDTCYSFWIGGTLQLLGALPHSSVGQVSEFVTLCEQRLVGGFAKTPDAEYPDILHSFYSMSWFSLVEDPLWNLNKLRCELAICDHGSCCIETNSETAVASAAAAEPELTKAS